MKTEIGIGIVGAAICAVMVWAAWRLAGEPFYAACGVFVAAFWGSMAALAVWSGISTWSERREARSDLLSKVRYRR